MQSSHLQRAQYLACGLMAATIPQPYALLRLTIR